MVVRLDLSTVPQEGVFSHVSLELVAELAAWDNVCRSGSSHTMLDRIVPVSDSVVHAVDSVTFLVGRRSGAVSTVSVRSRHVHYRQGLSIKD